MTKITTWTILALSVLLIGGCGSSGGSSSKDALYRQVFEETQASAPVLQYMPVDEQLPAEAEESPNVTEAKKEFNPADYALVTKNEELGFYEYYDSDNPGGVDAISVLVESTPTLDKYVYILGRIEKPDSFGPDLLPTGPMEYKGDIEYYDPEKDPNLELLHDEGKFQVINTFSGVGSNTISFDWDGDGKYEVITDKKPDNVRNLISDFLFEYDFPDSNKQLVGHGTFHNEWGNVYGLFSSPNYAGGFKGACVDNCFDPPPQCSPTSGIPCWDYLKE